MLEDEEVRFDPDEYVRGFSDEQIASHLRGVIRIVETIDPPLHLAIEVFRVAQQMRASMERRESPVEVPKMSMIKSGRG